MSILLGSAVAASTAAGQQAAPSGNQPASSLCQIEAHEAGAAPVKELRASCRSFGVSLGQVTDFDVITNDALRATLVDARLRDERRLFLLTIQDDGRPLVEDLSGQLALAAGRGPMSTLEGIDVDLSAFEKTGKVQVQQSTVGRANVNGGQIDLKQQVLAERARRISKINPIQQ